MADATTTTTKQKVRADQVDGGVRKAKNGRDYVRLKKGGSRMLSKDDAKRLRSELKGKSGGSSSSSTKKKSGGSSSSSTKKKKNPDKKPKRRRKKFLADFL